jgi:hypothetical protein
VTNWRFVFPAFRDLFFLLSDPSTLQDSVLLLVFSRACFIFIPIHAGWLVPPFPASVLRALAFPGLHRAGARRSGIFFGPAHPGSRQIVRLLRSAVLFLIRTQGCRQDLDLFALVVRPRRRGFHRVIFLVDFGVDLCRDEAGRIFESPDQKLEDS